MKTKHGIGSFNKTLLAVFISTSLVACGSSDDAPIDETPTNASPVVTSSASLSVIEGESYSYTIAATDSDGDTLTFSVGSMPSWLSFNATTGVLSGTPATADVGTHSIVLSVSDGSEAVSQTFSLEVSAFVAPNSAPVVTSTALTSAKVGTAYSYTMTVADAENDTLVMSSVAALPAWAQFDAATGVLSGTPDVTGDFSIELLVSDGSDSANHNFTITVSEATASNVALLVFENTALPQWAAWDCCGNSTPGLVTDDAAHDQVTEFTISGDTVVGFTARADDGAVGGSPFNASSITPSGSVSFDLKLTKLPDAGVVNWKFKVESNGGASNAEVNLSSSQEAHTTPVLNTWQTYTFNLANLAAAGLDTSAIDLFMVFPVWGSGNGAEYYIDNLSVFDGGGNYGSNISGGSLVIDITQGIDFEGTEAEQTNWEAFENGDPSPALEFVTNPSLVGNTSTGVAKLTPLASDPCCGKYAGVVTHQVQPFTLSASNALVKIWVYKDKISPVGVKFEKFNGDGYGSHGELTATNTKINEWEELTIDFTSQIGLPENTGISGIAIFPDMVDGRTSNAVTYLDNLTFTSNGGGGTGGGGDGSALVSNGDFESGTSGWIGAVNVVADGANNVFQAEVLTAGNPWDVNLSQVMTLSQNTSYELTFKAKASIDRNILAGLGLNADPWTNVTETVALTTSWQTFTYTITTTGFGDANSRVLFDLGADTGIVNIDDVSVTETTASGGGDVGGGDGSAPVTVGFENGGSGNAGFTWAVFENDDNPAVEFVSNPDSAGINTSTTVAKFTARQTGQPWAGTETAHGDIATFTLDSTNSTIKIMVYKTVISDVGIKFAIANGGAQPEIKVANTLVNQWEELSFDFSGYIGLTEAINIDQLIIFPDFNTAGRASDTVTYFDNVTFGN